MVEKPGRAAVFFVQGNASAYSITRRVAITQRQGRVDIIP